MQHHSVAYVDSHVRHAIGVRGCVGVFKEYVARRVIFRFVVARWRGSAVIQIRELRPLRPIACHRVHRRRQRVLLFKEHVERSLHVDEGPRPLVHRADDGDKRVGVVPYRVEVEDVAVVAGVEVGVAVDLALQRRLTRVLSRGARKNRKK